MNVGENGCWQKYVSFNLTGITKSKEARVRKIHVTSLIKAPLIVKLDGNARLCDVCMQVEVYIHDPAEEFTNVLGMQPERMTIMNSTTTRLLVRPQVVQRLSKKDAPCIQDDGYSYARVGKNSILI